MDIQKAHKTINYVIEEDPNSAFAEDLRHALEVIKQHAAAEERKCIFKTLREAERHSRQDTAVGLQAAVETFDQETS